MKVAMIEGGYIIDRHGRRFELNDNKHVGVLITAGGDEKVTLSMKPELIGAGIDGNDEIEVIAKKASAATRHRALLVTNKPVVPLS